MVFVELFRKVCPCLMSLALMLPMSACSGGAAQSEKEASAPIEDDPALKPPVDTTKP
ncbi:hypothetical protein GmarT_02410 [Gimesia maris]|uniref:Uncharacterized protein n=1 Tax=Gimesia maris TaxID=122 RepID=A0ABX5YFG0_9PLAN|nr:hypothetical protein Mal35_02550 [Gimesia maris]QDU12468.1 hypothetical protein CA11_02470 [Gimesia maris]QEG14406.1 hypothetical protein GmarT_02410 [Gimesia maris]